MTGKGTVDPRWNHAAESPRLFAAGRSEKLRVGAARGEPQVAQAGPHAQDETGPVASGACTLEEAYSPWKKRPLLEELAGLTEAKRHAQSLGRTWDKGRAIAEITDLLQADAIMRSYGFGRMLIQTLLTSGRSFMARATSSNDIRQTDVPLREIYGIVHFYRRSAWNHGASFFPGLHRDGLPRAGSPNC